MRSEATRRILKVLAGYVVGGWAVRGLGQWLAGVLALPPLFDRLLWGGSCWAFPSRCWWRGGTHRSGGMVKGGPDGD